jgi:soluble lytic murein transglycosylase-like protein
MTLPLSRATVQRLINPPTVQRSLSLPSRTTFASTLARVQGGTASLLRPSGGLSSALPAAGRLSAGVRSASLASPGALASGLLAPSGGSRPAQLPLVAQGATGLDAYKDLVQAAAHKYGLDPTLLAAVAQTESGFNPRAQSQAGAKGLMQLMDATARGLGVTDSFDPAQSLDGGARFLSGLLKQFNGDPRLALAAYNAGPVAVKKYGGIPPYEETQRYVPKVLAQADAFRRLFAANLPAPESS